MSTEPTSPEASEGQGEPDEPVEEAVAVGESETGQDPVEVVHAPSRLSQGVALVAAVVGVALTSPFVLLSVPFAVAGLGLVAGSLVVAQSRGWLAVGTGLILLAAILGGTYGAVPVEFMLVGVSATLLALDVGQYGIGVGQQLGRQTRTRRLEVVHATFTLIALTVVNAVAYAVFLFGGSGRPASAVALSVIGAIALMWVFRR